MNFKNKVVLITGGSRGIGRATVEYFSKNEAAVSFTYSKQESSAQETATLYAAEAYRCSQTSDTEIGHTVEAILKKHGHIDILVNNAGITADQFLMLMSSEDWLKVMDTNINGAYRWTKAVSRPMLEAHSGVVINVASVSGLVGTAGQTNYAASKGALLAFTRACAAELGPKGIRVNAVVPGFITTDMTAKMPRNVKNTNLERILLKRFGKPEEVSAVIGFLASDAASYIAGQTIVVDGGLTATVS